MRARSLVIVVVVALLVIVATLGARRNAGRLLHGALSAVHGGR